MLWAALTTAPGRLATRDSASTTSMSVWSMTAMSPGSSRLVRFFVRRSMRTRPTTPGPPSGTAWRRIRNILTCRWSHGATGGRSTARSPRLALGAHAGQPLGLRGREQLAGVGLRAVRVLHAAEHPGQLPDPALLVEGGDATHGHLTVARLPHPEVTVGVGGDLREVRDDQNLRGPREPGQPPADAERRPPPDAGVHLVEDERRHWICGSEHHLETQHEPGELATGGALRDGPGRRTRVRHQEELDVVDAVRPGGQAHRAGAEIDLEPLGVLPLPHVDDQPCVGHRQVG